MFAVASTWEQSKKIQVGSKRAPAPTEMQECENLVLQNQTNHCSKISHALPHRETCEKEFRDVNSKLRLFRTVVTCLMCFSDTLSPLHVPAHAVWKGGRPPPKQLPDFPPPDGHTSGREQLSLFHFFPSCFGPLTNGQKETNVVFIG